MEIFIYYRNYLRLGYNRNRASDKGHLGGDVKIESRGWVSGERKSIQGINKQEHCGQLKLNLQ